MSDPDAGGGGDLTPDGYARRAMGVRALGDMIRRRRGEQGLSQKAAARAWGFPYTTLCDIERGTVRNYQVANIARLDPVLGVDAWAVLHQSDTPPGVDELRAELDELREVVTELREVCGQIETPAAGVLEGLGLTDAELGLVVAFAHLLLSRRGSS